MDLKETDILGDEIHTHWYYRSKAAAMRKLLGDSIPPVIMDVGAGSAFFSKYLLSCTTAREAWCVDTSFAEERDDTYAGKVLHFRRSIGHVDAGLVLLMDVLEHVDDDVEMLRLYVGKVRPGTLFLVSVPAFQSIWSGHDIFLEHKRRYTLSQIEDVVNRSGLTVERGVYFFGSVFPLAAAIRLTQQVFSRNTTYASSQLRKHSPFINAFLGFISNAELYFLNKNRFVGLTAFCLARN